MEDVLFFASEELERTVVSNPAPFCLIGVSPQHPQNVHSSYGNDRNNSDIGNTETRHVKAQTLASCSRFNSPKVFQRPVLVDLIGAILDINIEKF